ncbi:hypothetical protein QKU48_gp0054 [Fadolivirus algeromassiliense]|jgi:hypothetical protein|uniref:Uncharacterized protein n=1 Tax=Fadolivirus FV1/VV64 TaxID=3070911 RepID=A0A7D3V598_9VIRU|nr:hypothetical protein QKU48_gp0054 [Fadolivirus algeromassiliense]QKF93512.1 hypothetical protein Fadolivirus_1_54 [Fadolivirus FV1/VV64]
MTDIISIFNNINIIQKRIEVINNILDDINKQDLLKSMEIANAMEFIKKYKDFKQLLGPSSIVVYKINNKLLILLQDIHKDPDKECNETCSKNGCNWIHEFLEDLFIRSPVCIDFFNETTEFLQLSKGRLGQVDKSFLSKIIQKIKSYTDEQGLFKSIKHFADCLGPQKVGCQKYGKVRFHNIEFRRFENPIYNIFGFKNEGPFRYPIYYLYPKKFDIDKIKSKNNIKEIKIKKYPIYKKYLDTLPSYEHILKGLLDGDMKKVSEHLMRMNEMFKDTINQDILKAIQEDALKTISPYPKLAKQFSALPENIKQICKSYLLKEYNDWIKGLITTINQIKHIETKENIYKINKILSKINFYYGVIIFDAYTIGRMMKSIYLYKDSSIIITYAGKSHTKGYSILFNELEKEHAFKLNKITEIKSIVKDGACINLSQNQKEWNKVMNELESLFANPTNCSVRR